MSDCNLKSLPPLVEGRIYGHLTVTIDEILWCPRYSNDVIVLLQWWGEKESLSLRPADITKYPESVHDNTSVKYNIRTSLPHLQSYLKQCNKLKLLLINNSNKKIVGHVEVDNLDVHITGLQIQNYFPIITSSGSRIGDLCVKFDLSMNSITKKSKKRCKRKNKPHSSFRPIEHDKCKQNKESCKACTDNIKTNNPVTGTAKLELLHSPMYTQVPPNTDQSDSSDGILLEVLEKGKKLRDDMILTVLDDSDPELNEELLSKSKVKTKEYKHHKTTTSYKNGEILTPHEEKLINDYLKGKTMKEEEEIIVLNTLHAGHKDSMPKPICDFIQKEEDQLEVCGLEAKSSGPHSVSASSNTAVRNTIKHCGSDLDGELLKKINCFRLTVDNLTLTSAGWKKISHSTDNKSKSSDVPPPGATYFVECQFVEDSPRSETKMWKSTALRFCSRRQIENVVYFGQSSAHTVRSLRELGDMMCLVCWRHLNQRVPALLGRFSLGSLVVAPRLVASACLPVTSDHDTCVGTLSLRLELGRDKLYFGHSVKNGLQNVIKNPVKLSENSGPTKVKPLDIIDLCSDSENDDPDVKTVGNQIVNLNRKMNPQQVNPVLASWVECTNCGQKLRSSVEASPDTSVCVNCHRLFSSHPRPYVDQDYMRRLPTTFVSGERRYHKFLLNIDAVIGFPLFAGVEDELSCYVDYRFPEITSGFKVELSKSETTSRVVGCETRSQLSSVHSHSLCLPLVLPLAPLLASCCPGLTLRLWLRYYKPCPRDHMVAMALLPMDELCLMELEFDKRRPQSPVTKVLMLPLALVPSSVTSSYQQSPDLGALRVCLTYSNFVSGEDTEQCQPTQGDVTRTVCEDSMADEKRFWTGPFGKENTKRVNTGEDQLDSVQSTILPSTNHLESENLIITEPCDTITTCNHDVYKDGLREHSQPVMKKDFDILAESLEHRFNQLQSDLMKERQKELNEFNKIDKDSRVTNGDEINSIMPFPSLSSNSSMDSLPFILGPPMDFKDVQNTVVFSKTKKSISYSESDKSLSDTISGFLKEDKCVANMGSNEDFDKSAHKLEIVKPKTFKANVKIDRAVNLKAIKSLSNGKKGKVPPSCWVSFGIGNCCEQNCRVGGVACTSQRFTTSVIRRNHNPIWNYSWDIDLPLDYLQQVRKRLVFGVFEENLDVALGFASANLSILTSGLPCLSSWLSIDDLAGTCKGQIKIVVTPLEDLSKYQECLVYDMEEEYFEETKLSNVKSIKERREQQVSFVASRTEIFVNENKGKTSTDLDKEVENLMKCSDDLEDGLEGEDPFSAEDIISDYKNTLENNFRNEMAGLENLIKFLRVGTSELSLFGGTENKENQSFNLSSQPATECDIVNSSDVAAKLLNSRSSSVNCQMANLNGKKDRILIDASTETAFRDDNPSSSNQQNGEDVLSKLLQQITLFQPPPIKIIDNTCQTIAPEMKEKFTETDDSKIGDCTVHLKDASTETDDISDGRSQEHPHLCDQLGSVLLQHFLTCKPAPVKVADSASQTTTATLQPATADSSGVFMSSSLSSDFTNADWVLPQSNSERLTAIDNNIKDLELFLEKNLTIDNNEIPPPDSIEGSSCGSINDLMDSVQTVKENRRLSSDVESLENYSQALGTPIETLDVENLSMVPVHGADTIASGPILQRRGTFVIERIKDVSQESTVTLDSEDL